MLLFNGITNPRGGFLGVFDILSTIFPKLPLCMGCEDEDGLIRWGQELHKIIGVPDSAETILRDDHLGGVGVLIRDVPHTLLNSDFKPLSSDELERESYVIINFHGKYKDRWLLFVRGTVEGRQLCSIMEIGEHLSRFQELLRESELDPMTGLFNREAFLTRSYELLADSRYALMTFIDLDNLKQINDNWGHMIGDKYIIAIARHLESLPVPAAKRVCGRISGDEFGLFIGRLDSEEERNRCLDGLIADVKFPLPDHSETRLCFTTGAARYPEDANNVEDLVVFSDFAMNNMKKTDKGGIGYFCRKSHEIFLDLSARQNKLYEILDNKAIDFIYYPYISSSTKQIVMYEMLPASRVQGFEDIEQVKIVSKYGHKVVELDNVICERMAEELKMLADIGFPQVLSLGYIPQSLLYQGGLSKVFEGSDFPMNKICLYFNADMRDGFARMKAIDVAKGFGMVFGFKDYTPDSVDDAVLDFRPNKIKIIKDVVKGCAQSEAKRELIRKLLDQSEKMNFDVAAGNVDTLEDLKCVTELGVDFIGGDAVYEKIKAHDIPRLSRLPKK